MLLTLLQLHILLTAVPALTGWPTWAMVPAPAFVAHVQRMGAPVVQAQTDAVRSAAVPYAPSPPAQAVLFPVSRAVVPSVTLCGARAPRAP